MSEALPEGKTARSSTWLSHSLCLPSSSFSHHPKHTSALFTESTQFITELHFHLHTNYFKELEQVGVGGGHEPLRSQDPWDSFPGPGQGREH